MNIIESVQAGPVFQFVMVLPNGPWDYKQQGPYDAFGNFNFGATGAALGYTDEELLGGAGALKRIERVIRRQSEPTQGVDPWGNEAEKAEEIKAGIDYFRSGCELFFKAPL